MKKLKKACLEFGYFALDNIALLGSGLVVLAITAMIEYVYHHGIQMILPAIRYGFLSALASCGALSVIGAIGYIGKKEEDKAAINEASKNETENE